MRGGARWILLALWASTGPANAVTSETLTFHGRFQAWKVFRIEGPDLTVCFAASRASRYGPRWPTRSRPILYITRYPKTSTANTIELRFGGSVSQFGSVSAKLLARRKPAEDRYAITVKSDVGFIADAKNQMDLTEAMKKGRSLLLVSEPGRGEILEDRFSLFGYTKALAKLETLCPGPAPAIETNPTESPPVP